MPTPRRTPQGRANVEKARTTPRAGRIRAFKFGQRQDAKGVSRTGRQAPAQAAPARSKPTGTGPFAGGLRSADLLRERGTTALGRRLR